MTEPQYRSDRRVPPRALLISVAALAVPVAGAFLLPAATVEQYGALLWLLALVPAFLLAYYRGWKGVATALAAGMATLSLTQVAMSWVGRPIPDLLSGVVAAYVTISLGVGWLAELMHRDREEVEDLAFTDLLTHLPNRRHARVFLENEFAAAERGRLLSVVLFDLDHFKRYNDRYGHVAGDDALQVFAVILAQSTRRMNLSARFGGEEFLTVLAGSDVEGALVFAERIRVALKATSLERGSLTASAGVATFHPSMRSPDELLAAADHALYRAKREGRNCVRLFGRPPADAVKTDDAELVVPSSFPDP
ncbi:MAG: diguanylate cyclase, partial [Gemmatimonadetes bacterium]|nr:diguanylate cyclase [Gemmatimonadota bacterium]